MPEAKYLLIGSSHAALEALRAIRAIDAEGSAAMLTMDAHLPYSPTVLPYVVSGRSKSSDIALRDEAFFQANHCVFVPNARAAKLDAGKKQVLVSSGEVWGYEKLLIATGSAPSVPPISGLHQVPYHVLRTLGDAQRLREAFKNSKTAIVLGGGLVGLHAAETMAEAGLAVTIIEARDHVLAGYFSASEATRIQSAFADHDVDVLVNRSAIEVLVTKEDRTFWVTLDNGTARKADLLLVAAGAIPAVGWLEDSGVDVDRGVLVDDTMRTNVPDVWAAGDVAQATEFASGVKKLIGIIPTAVEQGRVAGFDMAGDEAVKPYAGGVPVNTYRFFGRVALSIGQAAASEGVEVAEHQGDGYRRIVMSGGCLVGYASVDEPFDVGVMGELIRRKVDLAPVKADFLARPLDVGRRLMSEGWR